MGIIAGALALTGCGGGRGGGTGAKPSATPTASRHGGLAARGEEVAKARGCLSCHSLGGSRGVGPTWKGLAGSRVKLTGGRTVTADDAYLRTAIEDPDRQVVAGYPRGVMTNVIPAGSVSAADAKALVAYIKTLR